MPATVRFVTGLPLTILNFLCSAYMCEIVTGYPLTILTFLCSAYTCEFVTGYPLTILNFLCSAYMCEVCDRPSPNHFDLPLQCLHV
jgi:hypothetical protein